MARISKESRKETIIHTALDLFSKHGFYNTTIPDIAKQVGMSVGNFYNYFRSKDILAKELILYISDYLGKNIETINQEQADTKEKINKIVSMYFEMAQKHPEMIEYFLRVYLSNREVFGEECQGMVCVSSFVTELMLFFEEGVKRGELRDQDFFSAFGLFMGYLGGMVFLHGEKILPNDLDTYTASIAENIYNALKA